MRLNKFGHGLNGCGDTIAPRCDLAKNGYPFGAIDAKVTNSRLLSILSAWIVSSPT